MLIYIVQISFGEWDDYSTGLHSIWDSKEVADKLCAELNNQIRNIRKDEPDVLKVGGGVWWEWREKTGKLHNANEAWVEQHLLNHII